MTCPSEGLQFPIESGVPLLVRPSSKARVEAFEGSYAAAWSKAGWGSEEDAYFFNLPFRDITGRHTGDWDVKRRSMAALFSVLDKVHPHRVVDLGCGMGWLSYHLARRGCRVQAVDIVRDSRVGLAAAGRYARKGPFFERIWGELERPPFRNSSVDAVVCNASLHYARDHASALEEVRRVLRPGGLFVVLNSPVHRDVASALRAQDDFRQRLRHLGATDEVATAYHHFARESLVDAIRKTIGHVDEAPFSPGSWFQLHRRAKQLFLRMELASFPVLYAKKT